MNCAAAWTYLQRLLARDESGASLIEYVLLAALIAIVCIVGMTYLGSDTSNKLTSVGNLVSSAS